MRGLNVRMETLHVTKKPMSLTLQLLDLRLHIQDGVRRLHLQRPGLAGQRLQEDLRTAATTQ